MYIAKIKTLDSARLIIKQIFWDIYLKYKHIRLCSGNSVFFDIDTTIFSLSPSPSSTSLEYGCNTGGGAATWVLSPFWCPLTFIMFNTRGFYCPVCNGPSDFKILISSNSHSLSQALAHSRVVFKATFPPPRWMIVSQFTSSGSDSKGSRLDFPQHVSTWLFPGKWNILLDFRWVRQGTGWLTYYIL